MSAMILLMVTAGLTFAGLVLAGGPRPGRRAADIRTIGVVGLIGIALLASALFGVPALGWLMAGTR